MNTLDRLGVDRIGSSQLQQSRPGFMGRPPVVAGPSFEQVLRQQLVFSAHAQDRLSARGIALGPQQLSRLQTGVDRAAGKGSKDSLVLLDDLAFVVNVNSRTVVTAMYGNRTKDGIFTQIDSAVIV